MDAKRRRTERIMTLAESQGGVYIGNSTAKRIVPNDGARGRGYDPFAPLDKGTKKAVIEYCKKLPGSGKRKTIKTAKEYPIRFWWYDLLNQKEWLEDTHLNATVFLLRTCLMEHAEWFRSDRICFVDTYFGHYWSAKYNEFKMVEANKKGEGKPLPTLLWDYYKGAQPEPRPTNKIWGIDIDELYVPFNVKTNHWVALLISLPKRHITVYDSLPHHVKPAELHVLLEPLAVMFPYLMRTLADEETKYMWTLEPFTYDRPIGQEIVPQQTNINDCGVFTMKYIECHALGVEFPQTLCHANIPDIRLKLAGDLYHETGVRGPKERDWAELD
ncbi:unnamed protein product [Microthlaspi erraticum]|uniref:Ubiquitin-like protease family profile domain-containing protein n=1 Tax=Microthlaspi erraticum TaxID=1685480 RepID=A0A6D2LDC3_9BRAS|nr:unnamed protein product [Microthlaspi erraticum]